MSYKQYGISPELVERVKKKMRSNAKKDQVKAILHGVTKEDLQNRVKVRKLAQRIAAVLNEPVSPKQLDHIVRFVIAQKIDPANTFRLIRLWAMFQ